MADVLNHQIIDQLERLILQTQYEQLITPKKVNHFRLQHFNDALKKIRTFDFEIIEGSQLTYYGLGLGLVRRIDEILEHGTLKELTMDAKYFERIKVIQELTKLPGIGWIKANQIVKDYWIFNNLTSQEIINDLKMKHNLYLLPWETQLALKHLDSLDKKIPRSEIDLVKERLARLSCATQFEICGSYRRGLTQSNDIDVLFYIKTGNKQDRLLSIVQELSIYGIITDHITKVKNHSYRGYCKFLTDVRRIDLFITDENDLAFGLLYFTGSTKLNRVMRLKALKMGYILNQFGLFNRSDGSKVECQTEQDIFEFLNMTYVPPTER